MSIHHSFDIEHAQFFGLPEAVLISNLQFWISKNAANGVHQHEGRTWTYNSAKAFAALFPYLTDRQIRRTIDSLTDQAVVMKGNYNASACDRTLWLAFVDEAAFLTVKKPAPKSANGAPKKAKPAPKSANGCAGIGESLIEQIVNTDVNTDRESADAHRPPMTGAICMVMKASGMQGVNPSHPDLKVLIDKGADIGLFAEVARDCVAKGKPFAYALAVIKGRMKDAAALADTAMSKPAAASTRRTPAPDNFQASDYGQGGKL